MELYIIEDYKNIYPQLRGSALTDALVQDLLIEQGYAPDEEIWKAEEIQILRLEGGKPVLTGALQLPLSVSHTGDVFGCVIASPEETDSIGLDLQRVRHTDLQRLARRWFTEAEQQYLGEEEDEDALEARFFTLWTRKEAYAKYTGEGLAGVLQKGDVLKRTDVVFQDLILGDGLFGCICSRK